MRAVAALVIVAAVVGAGCGGSTSVASPGLSANPSSGPSAAAASGEATLPPAATAAASPAATVAPAAQSGSASMPPVPAGGVTIVYEENAQVEILSPAGQRVLVDVWDTGRLTRPATAADILLTTHSHADHYDAVWAGTFPGRTLTFREGSIEQGDVTITGIPAAHNEGDPFLPKDGTDYIFVIDVGGLRIVHFGDCGQAALTPTQMKAVGRVDVAVSQLGNAYSDVDATNHRDFDLMNQVRPAVLIPTHVDVDVDGLAVVKLAATDWHAAYTLDPSVTLTRDGLPTTTTALFMGLNAQVYAPIAHLPESDL